MLICCWELIGFLLVLEVPDRKGQSVDPLQKKAYTMKQILVYEAGSVEGSCNTSLMTHTKETLYSTQSQPKDSTSEAVMSEERKTEEATKGSSKDVSKMLTEKEGTDLKWLHKSPLLKLELCNFQADIARQSQAAHQRQWK